jgi:hypothetical protein
MSCIPGSGTTENKSYYKTVKKRHVITHFANTATSFSHSTLKEENDSSILSIFNNLQRVAI